MLIRFICWLLKHKKLTLEDRTTLTKQVLDSINALPISDVIEINSVGEIYVNKRKLDIDQALTFKANITTLDNSPARRLIHEHLKFLAVKTGVHEGMTPDQIYFSKAMLYCLQEEEKLIKKLALE